jgi:hypothetical protein
MRGVLLFNTSSAGYSISTNNSVSAFNYSLFIQYSGPRISAAYLVSPLLFNSTLFRLLFMCNSAACSYGGANNVTFTTVFMNNDTRIFRLSYGG